MAPAMVWKPAEKPVKKSHGWVWLGIVFGVAVFAGMTWQILGGKTPPWDMDLFMMLHPKKGANQYSNVYGLYLRHFTLLGEQPLRYLASGLVLVYLVCAGRIRGILFMAAVTISATVLDPSLKAFFGHPRPDNAYHYVQMTSFSFPSGHSLLAMATWFSLAMLAMYYSRRPLTRAFAVFYGLLIPTLVGFSRVYLGVHWPSDVFAGLGLGLALVLFWYLLIMTTFPETDYQDVTK